MANLKDFTQKMDNVINKNERAGELSMLNTELNIRLNNAALFLLGKYNSFRADLLDTLPEDQSVYNDHSVWQSFTQRIVDLAVQNTGFNRESIETQVANIRALDLLRSGLSIDNIDEIREGANKVELDKEITTAINDNAKKLWSTEESLDERYEFLHEVKKQMLKQK